MRHTLIVISLILSQLAKAEYVVTDANGERSYGYSEYFKIHGSGDSLNDFMIQSAKDTIYHFRSILSRVIVNNVKGGVALKEVFAVPQPGSETYKFAVVRSLSVKGKSNKTLSKPELTFTIPVRDSVRSHLEQLRKAISSQKTIDEYDLPLVHLSALVIWEMTLVTLSGDNEFYSVLTNLTTELPVSVAGKAAYAWNDCKYLLREQKIPGFITDF